MGKGWRGGKFGGDLTSARGSACVIGTCDTARERESSKELVNILNQALDALYPTVAETADRGKGNDTPSIQDELAAEISAVRSGSHTMTQRVVSVHTGMTGFVLAKLVCPDACPVRLVTWIFDRISADRLPLAKHLVRIIPLQRTFFPDSVELDSNLTAMVSAEFGVSDALIQTEVAIVGQQKRPATELDDVTLQSSLELDASLRENVEESGSTTDLLKQQHRYNIFFNRRNHNVLTRHVVIDAIVKSTGSNARYNYKTFTDGIVVDLFKNLGGMSYVRNIEQFHDMNIRKFQASLGIDFSQTGKNSKRNFGANPSVESIADPDIENNNYGDTDELVAPENT